MLVKVVAAVDLGHAGFENDSTAFLVISKRVI